MAMPPNTRRSVALIALIALPASCSTLPEARWPVALEGEVEVLYRFGGAAPRLFRVPSSDDTLTVLWLEAAPADAVEERFVRGERIWIAADGQQELRIRCGYRWTGADRPSWEQQFPGGTVVADRDR